MKSRLKIGVVYPQTEYGDDPAAIRDYAQTVEGLGFTHILAYDHVIGANPNRAGGWKGSYTYESAFQEPFVLFSYLAGVTRKIGFTTGILILPQRQTVLVAKQAATLDGLSGGRLRLGVGLGWNEVEYTALNEDFHNRGRRIEEQVEVMRLLWTQPLVQFAGRWHTILDAGLKPLPVQQPIPIWFGGHHESVLRRVAHMGDGWMPRYRSPKEALPSVERINHLLDDAGRSRDSIGLEGRIDYGDGNPQTWTALVEGWQALDTTHLTINTMGSGFTTPAAHLRALRTFAQEFTDLLNK